MSQVTINKYQELASLYNELSFADDHSYMQIPYQNLPEAPDFLLQTRHLITTALALYFNSDFANKGKKEKDREILDSLREKTFFALKKNVLSLPCIDTDLKECLGNPNDHPYQKFDKKAWLLCAEILLLENAALQTHDESKDLNESYHILEKRIEESLVACQTMKKALQEENKNEIAGIPPNKEGKDSYYKQAFLFHLKSAKDVKYLRLSLWNKQNKSEDLPLIENAIDTKTRQQIEKVSGEKIDEHEILYSPAWARNHHPRFGYKEDGVIYCKEEAGELNAEELQYLLIHETTHLTQTNLPEWVNQYVKDAGDKDLYLELHDFLDLDIMLLEGTCEFISDRVFKKERPQSLDKYNLEKLVATCLEEISPGLPIKLSAYHGDLVVCLCKELDITDETAYKKMEQLEKELKTMKKETEGCLEKDLPKERIKKLLKECLS